MSRYCSHCGSQIELTDAHCPYCSATQIQPGDPFKGFLLHHAPDIIGVLLFIILFLGLFIAAMMMLT